MREGAILAPNGERIPIRVHSIEHRDNGIETEFNIEGRIVEGPPAKLMLSTLDRRMRPSFAPSDWFAPRKPEIEKVIFNYPATVVYWSDNTKTIVKCQEGDTYNKELGLAMCIAKKYLGNKGNFNDEFRKWIP